MNAANRSAVISDDGLYRYRLDRGRRGAGGNICWIMLNPSTADAQQDDATIRRCWSFTGSWGQSSLTVVNLFAYRATSPADMKAASDPVGPENDRYIIEAVTAPDVVGVVAAWGEHGSHRGRSGEVRQLLMSHNIKLHCLARTRSGQPRHPLYLKSNLKPVTL